VSIPASMKKEKFSSLKLHQDKASENRLRVERIESALDELSQKKVKAEEAKKRVAEIVRHKEDLLAGLALGEGSKDDLTTIEKALEEAEGIVSELVSATGNESGLRRKLEEANSEMRKADEAVKYETDAYILAEAEEIGEEYAAAALTVARCFRRLWALSLIHEPRRVKGGPIGGNVTLKDFSIPVFGLESHRNIAAASPANRLGEGQDISVGAFINEALQEEEARLRDLGVIS